MTAVRIIAVRKPSGNTHSALEGISHYKWINEVSLENDIADRHSMVAWVEDGNRAYVSSPEGTADCFVNRSSYGTKFLQTHADSRSSNNLLNLPPC